MSYWISEPATLHSGREFDCASYDGMTPEQCVEYERHWVYWFESDHVYALPTVAFFMSTIGIFIIGYVLSQLLGYSRRQRNPVWRRALATTRYVSYRGFHIKPLRWLSPPVGVLFLAAVGTIYFLCMALVPRPYYWPDVSMDTSPPLGTRSGFLSVACMPFIFKSNWITLVTGISHEKLNVFHRWISFAFFVLALLHAIPFVVYHIHFHDMVAQVTQVEPEEYWTGIVALVFQGYLTFASLSPIRKLGYEFFKFTHYFSAAIFMLMFFWHCDGSLTSWYVAQHQMFIRMPTLTCFKRDYFIATAALYVPSLVYPWLRTFFEYGKSQKAEVSVEEHGAITISIPADFDWVPGQHCFLRFNNLGWQALSSHPFSICSLPSVTPGKSSSLVFHARRRGGLTARLHSLAVSQPKVTSVSVDGPYGGIDLRKFHASDRMLVIAGGSAAGWTLPFIAQFARLMAASTQDDAARDRSMRVVLATRDESVRHWYLQAVQQVLSENPSPAGSLAGLSIWVYFTGEDRSIPSSSEQLPKSFAVSKASLSSEEREVGSKSEDGELEELRIQRQQCHGRPDLQAIVQEEAAKAADATQSMGIFICGPPLMQNDVRNAVARENLQIVQGSNLGGSYLYCEHYSWA